MILASSCSQEENVQQQTVSFSDCKFVAFFEQNESRTYLEDGKYLRWTANDELSIFMGKTLNRQFRFTGETGDNSGGFEEASSPGFVTGNDLDNPCHYAIYPYAKATKITETGVITVNLPSEQTYAENSFGCGANTMVAVTSSLSDMELSFKNACGYLRFKLFGDDVTVKSVTLQSNGEEKLSGSATLIAANDKNPSITMSSTASDMITLDCGTGVKIGSTAETATEFWFVVPPTTFESGFTVTIKDLNDNEFTKSTSKKISIERNVIKPISAFEVEIVETIPTYHIATAGTLSSLISEEKKYTITTMKVTGYLNGDDIRFIRAMAGRAYNDDTTEGKLVALDLSEASIVEGGGAYCMENYTNSNLDGAYTSNNVIGAYMFKRCNFQKLLLPNNIISIEYAGVERCFDLKEINLPSSLISIGDYAFNETSIEYIVLPESLQKLGSYSFSLCPLKEIHCKSKSPLSANYFVGHTSYDSYKLVTSTCKLYVPKESLSAYQTANYWKEFSNIIEE